MMKRILHRLLSFFTGARDEAELSREMASHVAMLGSAISSAV
jgi:hypothetical protein